MLCDDFNFIFLLNPSNPDLCLSFFQTAILLDLVRNEVLRESRRADQDCIESDQSQDGGEMPPWASHALELVELILRPPEGGPPCLPDHSEQVHFSFGASLPLKQ